MVLFSNTSCLHHSLTPMLLWHRTHNFVHAPSYFYDSFTSILLHSFTSILLQHCTFHCCLASHTNIVFITGLNNNFTSYFVTLLLYSFIFFLRFCWCTFSCKWFLLSFNSSLCMWDTFNMYVCMFR